MAMFDGFSEEDFKKAIEANPEAWGKSLTSGLNTGSPAGNPGFSSVGGSGGGLVWTGEQPFTQADKDQFANWSNAQTGGDMTGDFETQTLQDHYKREMERYGPGMKYSDSFMAVVDGTDSYLGQSYQKERGLDNRSPNGGLPQEGMFAPNETGVSNFAPQYTPNATGESNFAPQGEGMLAKSEPQTSEEQALSPLDEFKSIVQSSNQAYQEALDAAARSGQYDRRSQIEDSVSHIAAEQSEFIQSEMDRLGLTMDDMRYSVKGAHNDYYRDLGVANSIYDVDKTNLIGPDYGGTNPRDIAAQPGNETVFTSEQMGDFTLQDTPDKGIMDDPMLQLISGALAPLTGGASIAFFAAAQAASGETFHAEDFMRMGTEAISVGVDALVKQGMSTAAAKKVADTSMKLAQGAAEMGSAATSAGADFFKEIGKGILQGELEADDIEWQAPDISDVLGDVQVQVPDYSLPDEDEGGASADSSDASTGGGSEAGGDSGGAKKRGRYHYEGDGRWRDKKNGEVIYGPGNEGDVYSNDEMAEAWESGDYSWDDMNEDVAESDTEETEDVLTPDDQEWWKDILAGVVRADGTLVGDNPFGDSTSDGNQGVGDAGTGGTGGTGTGGTGNATTGDADTGSNPDGTDSTDSGGKGDGTGTGEGDGDGEGDGGQDGYGSDNAASAGGKVSDAEWSDLFPYTKLTPSMKRELLPHINYIRSVKA